MHHLGHTLWNSSTFFEASIVSTKNNKIKPEISVLTLRSKSSSTVSPKVLKTIHRLARCILDFKNIFTRLGFSHFFAMLSFLSFFLQESLLEVALQFPMPVLIEVSRILEGASAHHAAWTLKFGSSHRTTN